MNTTATKTPAIASELMDAWLASVKSVVWSQDQVLNLTGSWVEQSRTMRNDGEKVLEVIVTQAKSNVEEMNRLATESAKSALDYVPGWDILTQADLRRQVADLKTRVDELAAK